MTILMKNKYLQNPDLSKWMLSWNNIVDFKSKIYSLKVLYKNLDHLGHLQLFISTKILK